MAFKPFLGSAVLAGFLLAVSETALGFGIIDPFNFGLNGGARWDADVPLDLESSFNALAPESFPHRHTCEGPDDMPAHVKASMIGCAQSIPITHGQLNLGTWQGIYLCEHRNHGGKRKVVATIWGE